MEYLQSFNFAIKYKSVILNHGAGALSRRHFLLFQLDACNLRFEHLKSLYATNEDFAKLYSICLKHPKGEFLVQSAYLFKGTCLCVPRCSTLELLMRKVHRGSLARHYGENQTLAMLREQYFSRGMNKDV